MLYDQLGCGRSDRPDDVAWSLAVFTDELQHLREHLGLDRIHLLGTSWGGMLALEHALARPDSIRSLILSSTLASAEEWVVEAKRLSDAIEGDDEEVLAEFERRHFYRGASRAARARPHARGAQQRGVRGDVGAERVDDDRRPRGLGRPRRASRSWRCRP